MSHPAGSSKCIFIAISVGRSKESGQPTPKALAANVSYIVSRVRVTEIESP